MLVTDAQVRAHLRIDGDEDVSVYVSAAEKSAQQFMNRKVYADSTELHAARIQAPIDLTVATEAYSDAITAAQLVDNCDEREAALFAARCDYEAALFETYMVNLGMVVNAEIAAAILLIAGHLYANREDVIVGATVAQIPMGSQYLLQPHRKMMGV